MGITVPGGAVGPVGPVGPLGPVNPVGPVDPGPPVAPVAPKAPDVALHVQVCESSSSSVSSPADDGGQSTSSTSLAGLPSSVRSSVTNPSLGDHDERMELSVLTADGDDRVGAQLPEQRQRRRNRAEVENRTSHPATGFRGRGSETGPEQGGRGQNRS